jgi:hypothetical protein
LLLHLLFFNTSSPTLQRTEIEAHTKGRGAAKTTEGLREKSQVALKKIQELEHHDNLFFRVENLHRRYSTPEDAPRKEALLSKFKAYKNSMNDMEIAMYAEKLQQFGFQNVCILTNDLDFTRTARRMQLKVLSSEQFNQAAFGEAGFSDPATWPK